jgi:hypothetical protein
MRPVSYLLLIELTVLLTIPVLALPSQLKYTVVQNKTSLANQSASVPHAAPKHISWDAFANALLRRVFRLLVELEINAMWYKDFFLFDYFQFFL